MKIHILTDNRVKKRGFLAEHGLLIFIEHENGNMLFDTGQSEVYCHNATLMGVDLNKTDCIVLSHGHYDHCGGLVSLIVKKAYNMAKQMNIPIIGVVENMSYIKCPDCEKEIKLFGESKLIQTAEELGMDILGRVPIDPAIAELVNKGDIESFSNDYLADAVDKIEKIEGRI